ncbi:hypothetical protein ACIPF8_19205 [Collimonas sp. NPDC087041]|uniref:hypothetical protein n=1 Tax=Collimonas sp. NPDC087041 TaxID=3363960 RepID=UPI0037F840EB
MKERPILFTGAMVLALLDGSKTQTRRIYKNRKHPDAGCDMAASELVREAQHVIHRSCPYGQPGDRLWVRETFRKVMGQTAGWIATDYRATYQHGDRLGDVVGMAGKWTPSIHMPRDASRIQLEIIDVRVERLQEISEADCIAEGIEPNWIGPLDKGPNGTGTEGWLGDEWRHYGHSVEGDPAYSALESYRSLWESINGAGSWDANPWVWVVDFRRTCQ